MHILLAQNNGHPASGILGFLPIVLIGVIFINAVNFISKRSDWEVSVCQSYLALRSSLYMFKFKPKFIYVRDIYFATYFIILSKILEFKVLFFIESVS